MNSTEVGYPGIATQLRVVKPAVNRSIPRYYRERLSNTTIAQFKNRLERIIEALDHEDQNKHVRQFMSIHDKEQCIAGWFDNCYISLRVNSREDDVC